METQDVPKTVTSKSTAELKTNGSKFNTNEITERDCLATKMRLTSHKQTFGLTFPSTVRIFPPP